MERVVIAVSRWCLCCSRPPRGLLARLDLPGDVLTSRRASPLLEHAIGGEVGGTLGDRFLLSPRGKRRPRRAFGVPAVARLGGSGMIASGCRDQEWTP